MTNESDSVKLIKEYVLEDNEKAKERIGLAFDVHEAFAEIRKCILVNFFKGLEEELKINFDSNEWETENTITEYWEHYPYLALYKKEWGIQPNSKDTCYSLCISSDRKKDLDDLHFGVARPTRQSSSNNKSSEEKIKEELNNDNCLRSGNSHQVWVWRKYFPYEYRWTWEKENLIQFYGKNNGIEYMSELFEKMRELSECLIDQCVEEARAKANSKR